MRAFPIAACLWLGGCNMHLGGPPFVSGQSPAAAESSASEPQPAGSLPPGAQGIGGGPNATEPNRLSKTFPVPF